MNRKPPVRTPQAAVTLTDVSMFTFDRDAGKVPCSDVLSEDCVNAVFGDTSRLPDVHKTIVGAPNLFRLLLAHELCRPSVSSLSDIWRRRELHEFDNNEKGTLAQLQVKRAQLERALKEDPLAAAELADRVRAQRRDMRNKILSAIRVDMTEFGDEISMTEIVLALRLVLRFGQALISGDNYHRESRSDDVDNIGDFSITCDSGRVVISSDALHPDDFNNRSDVLWAEFREYVDAITALH